MRRFAKDGVIVHVGRIFIRSDICSGEALDAGWAFHMRIYIHAYERRRSCGFGWRISKTRSCHAPAWHWQCGGGKSVAVGWTWGNGASSPMSWVCWWPMECSHRPRDWNRLNAGRLWEPCQQDKVEDLPRRRSLQNGKCTMHAETYLLWRPNSKQTSPSGILILIGSQDRWCKIRSFSWYSSVVTGNMVI